MRTLQDLLNTFAGNSNSAIINPHKIAINASYNDLYNQVQYLQGDLASFGLNSRSRLAIILSNSLEFVALFLAITCMRAVAVPLNPTLKQGDYETYLEDLNLDAIVVPRGAICECHAAVLAGLDKGVMVIECHYSEGQIVLASKNKVRSRLQVMKEPERPAEHDIAVCLNTSGTTGNPKAVSTKTWNPARGVGRYLMTRISGSPYTPKSSRLNE